MSYSYGDIEQAVKTLCAKRTAYDNFTLTLPQEPSAFRLIVSDPTNSVTLGGSYENVLYNTAQVYESGKSITLSWQGAESLVFDRYEIWDFAGLSGQRAMETAVLISLAIAGVYGLYGFITYRIACDHVLCDGAERQKI